MIVDASFVCLPFLLPPRTEARLRLERIVQTLQERRDLVAPQLAAYEISNTLRHKRKAVIGGTPDYRRALVNLALRSARIEPSNAARIEVAATMADVNGFSVYDACYVEVARRLGMSLVTADGGMAAHAKAVGVEAYLVPQQLTELEEDLLL